MTQTRYVFRKEPSIVAWPCTISVPKDGGGREDQIVTPRFKVLDRDAFKTALDAGGDAGILRAAIEGFEGLMDENGERVADDVAKQLLLGLPYALDGLVLGYLDMLGSRLPKN